MKLKKVRNKIAYFFADNTVKKQIDEGITDDYFYDYSYYVKLIAKSLRRFANDRVSHTVLNWKLPDNWTRFSEEEMQEYSDAETTLLNKWADILEISTDNLYDLPRFEGYFNALHGLIFEGTELTPELDALGRELDSWEQSIIDLKSDILAELGANHMYMWD